jgi:hypothetical protein
MRRKAESDDSRFWGCGRRVHVIGRAVGKIGGDKNSPIAHEREFGIRSME